MMRPILWAGMSVLLGYVITRYHLWHEGLAALLVVAFVLWVVGGAALLAGKGVSSQLPHRRPQPQDADLKRAAEAALKSDRASAIHDFIEGKTP